MSEPLVSIVMPAYNEAGNIPRLEAELTQVLEGLPYRFEFLVVEGGSDDGTPELLRELSARDPRWKHVELTRRFSVEASITAGYAYARGDAIVVLYSDLQEPPELIPEFLEKWQQGYDSVYGEQTAREGEGRLRSWLVRRAYRLIGASSDVPIPADACDFRLITSEVRDALMRCEERVRYLRGLVAWLGFRQAAVPYVRRRRLADESKASTRLLARYFANGLFGFSLRPLHAVGWAGGLLLAIALVAGLIAAVLGLTGSDVPLILGVTAIVAALVGVNTLALWLVGEYVGRSYVESLRRPLYLVRDSVHRELARSGAGDEADLGQGNDEPGAPGH
jgi:polyisoprenyl-phosphate glycosyltransferase